MKKISLLIGSVILIGLASCDMDKTPFNAIPDVDALQTPTDFDNLRVGLYSPLRGQNSGGYYLAPELMTDNFNAVVGFSNTYGDMHRWQFTSQTGTFESIWGSYQGLIGRCNYIIDYAAKVDTTNTDVFDATDQALAKKVIGEAYFMRAWCLFSLSQYFCADYEASTASQANSGIAYSLTYSPTSDNSKYPARATLEETYQQIAADLAEARSRINVEGAVNSAYITVDVITALEARIALAKDDYATAASKAAQLINSNTYSLADDQETVTDMWRNGAGGEAILRLPIPSVSELAGQNGARFLPYTQGSTPDYIPTKELVDLYSANDYRLQAYFKKGDINTTNGTHGVVYEFNKYADTTYIYNSLKTESSRFMIEPMPFRIAEMYLIAAEAYAQSGNITEGAKYLNELEKARIADYEDQTFLTANSLMEEVKIERRREMVCEGTRLFDLKRWKQGVVRGDTQQDDLCLFPGSTVTTKLSKSASDFRMIFPIPKAETDANPQCVQNPGY